MPFDSGIWLVKHVGRHEEDADEPMGTQRESLTPFLFSCREYGICHNGINE